MITRNCKREKFSATHHMSFLIWSFEGRGIGGTDAEKKSDEILLVQSRDPTQAVHLANQNNSTVLCPVLINRGIGLNRKSHDAVR
jgi:hypothetical protein